jgi:hypothetical protein
MMDCQCPVVWYTWGCRLEHDTSCPLWRALHPVQAWLARLRERITRWT